MGSATAEECSERNIDAFSQMQRPMFYSCPDCGRKFTKRALEIHKQQCSENENCLCAVCKISKTKLSIKEDCILLDTEQSSPKKFKIKENFEHSLTNSLQHTKPQIENDVDLTSPIHLGNSLTSNPIVQDSASVENSIENNTEIVPAINNNTDSIPNDANKDTLNSFNSSTKKNIRIVNKASSKANSNNEVETSKDAKTTKSKKNNMLLADLKSKVAFIIKKREHRIPIFEKSDTPTDKDVDDPLPINEDSSTVDDPLQTNEYSSTLNDTELSLPSENIDRYHGNKICTRKIFCVICGDHILWKSFTMHVLNHCIKVVHNNFRCPLCSDNRSSATYFLMHFYKHISAHPSDCEDCKCDDPKCLESYAAPVAEHSYAESIDHRCYICLRYFGHFQTLINHMRRHSEELPFFCKECPRSFRQIGNLQRHMATHRGERPFKCEKCCRSFADPATLRNHHRVHTKETPYICGTCHRGFSQVGNLKRHMALHVQKGVRDAYVKVLDEEKTAVVQEGTSKADEVVTEPPKNSPCEVNEKASSRKRDERLNLHICDKCGKKYTWKHDLDIHFRTHTGEKPYKCELCPKRFAQSGAVRIHKIRHHATMEQIRERLRKKEIKALPHCGIMMK